MLIYYKEQLGKTTKEVIRTVNIHFDGKFTDAPEAWYSTVHYAHGGGSITVYLEKEAIEDVIKQLQKSVEEYHVRS